MEYEIPKVPEYIRKRMRFIEDISYCFTDEEVELVTSYMNNLTVVDWDRVKGCLDVLIGFIQEKHPIETDLERDAQDMCDLKYGIEV